MASPTPKRKRPNPLEPNLNRYPPRPPAGPPEVVDPKWLFQALGLTIVGALVCGYLTLCLLVYQGQWQLVLHPDTTHPVAPASLPVTPILFGAAESGQPRLAGWWIPVDPLARHARYTVLLLHDGSGNLAANVPTLEALHAAGLNVFAFDYRGFGASTPPHPNQQHMTQDADDALNYLSDTRHLNLNTVVPYGVGLGASLAAHLAEEHPQLPALILESPQPDVLAEVQHDSRVGMVPLAWFFHERFELMPALGMLRTPKLILTSGPSPVQPVPDTHAIDALAHAAGSPSMTVHLTRPVNGAAYRESLDRFLDEYMHP